MNSSSTLIVPPSTLKRVVKELDDLSKNPLVGASICMPNHNEPLTLRSNLLIMDGPFQDMIVHMIFHIPQDYPITPPTINLAPGLNFGQKYHGRLFDDSINGVQICSNLFKRSGWTTAYSLRSVLLQLQVLFADLDDYEPETLTEAAIAELRKHVSEFKTTIVLSDKKVATHSSESPYPALPSFTVGKKTSASKTDDDEVRKNAERWLSCARSKSNFFDKSRPVLGYPIDIRSDEFGSIRASPVVEMISYDAFIKQVSENPEKQDDYENVRFKSTFGDSYNFWMPVYINEEHWKAAYKQTRFALNVARKGFENSGNSGFKPLVALKVLTGFLSKIASQILQSKSEQTKAAIQAFSHFYHLLVRFIVEFPELQEDIDEMVDTARTISESRSKQDISDIGEFFIKLSLSKFGLQNGSLNLAMLEEYLARQVSWVLKADPKFLQQEWSLSSFVKAFIGHSRNSYQSLAVLIETLKVVMTCNSVFNSDNGHSVLPAKTLETHLKKVSWIKQTVAANGNWEALISSFGLDASIRREEDMAKVIQRAFEIAAKQRYTSNTIIPSFQNQRKKYEAIPFNPNFSFNRSTVINVTDSNTNSNTNKSTTKVTAIMSTATWADKKIELKGFEAHSTIQGIFRVKKETEDKAPGSNNSKSGLNKNSGKYNEESKDNKVAKATKIRKSDTDHSTAENSVNLGYETSNKNDEYFFNFGKVSNNLTSEGKGVPKTTKVK